MLGKHLLEKFGKFYNYDGQTPPLIWVKFLKFTNSTPKLHSTRINYKFLNYNLTKVDFSSILTQ